MLTQLPPHAPLAMPKQRLERHGRYALLRAVRMAFRRWAKARQMDHAPSGR